MPAAWFAYPDWASYGILYPVVQPMAGPIIPEADINGNRLRILFAPAQIIRRCKTLKCEYLVLPVIFANRSIVNLALSNDIEVWVYGTDDPQDLEYLAGCGVTGFIVDRSKSAIELFGNGGDCTPPGLNGNAMNGNHVTGLP